MRSSFIVLIAHCVYGNFLPADSMQTQLVPTQYLYTPRDYQKINDLEPPSKNSYYWYYMPLLTDDYLANVNWKYNDVPSESKRSKKALLIQRIPIGKTIDPGQLSLYLEPPTVESESDYANYPSHPMNLEEKQRINFLPKNHRPDVMVKNKKKKKIHDQGPDYIRDHAPVEPNSFDSDSDSKSEEISENKHVKKSSPKKESSGSLELSTDGDRIEFQIQGHEGPKTYIFGFDTGDGKNRQFRLEERLKDGTVKGQYGYYDARGKLRAIKYLARPVEGYKEKHHESNNIPYEENKMH